ncbi:hypothetical protein PSPO01_03908 [Paraphaeosphaeria sporulosa]
MEVSSSDERVGRRREGSQSLARTTTGAGDGTLVTCRLSGTLTMQMVPATATQSGAEAGGRDWSSGWTGGAGNGQWGAARCCWGELQAAAYGPPGLAHGHMMTFVFRATHYAARVAANRLAHAPGLVAAARPCLLSLLSLLLKLQRCTRGPCTTNTERQAHGLAAASVCRPAEQGASPHRAPRASSLAVPVSSRRLLPGHAQHRRARCCTTPGRRPRRLHLVMIWASRHGSGYLAALHPSSIALRNGLGARPPGLPGSRNSSFCRQAARRAPPQFLNLVCTRQAIVQRRRHCREARPLSEPRRPSVTHHEGDAAARRLIEPNVQQPTQGPSAMTPFPDSPTSPSALSYSRLVSPWRRTARESELPHVSSGEGSTAPAVALAETILRWPQRPSAITQHAVRQPAGRLRHWGLAASANELRVAVVQHSRANLE